MHAINWRNKSVRVLN